MPSATYNLFRRAILQRKQILCTYQAFYRETCPYTLGYRHGQEKALVFQFAGESSQRLPPAGEWRCFFLPRFAIRSSATARGMAAAVTAGRRPASTRSMSTSASEHPHSGGRAEGTNSPERRI